MDYLRVVELYNPHCLSGGTGYLIQDDLILTARHVITSYDQLGVKQACYDFRLLKDVKEGRTDWILEGCYLCWDEPEYDLALLKLEQNRLGRILTSRSATRFGKLTGESVFARGVGFPVVQEIQGRPNPEELEGKLSWLSGIREGQLRLQVTSPIPNSPDQWQGISGTALFVNDLLVGVIVETNKSFVEKALWATPISAIVGNLEFCRLIVGDSNSSILIENIGSNQSSQEKISFEEPRTKRLTTDSHVRRWIGNNLSSQRYYSVPDHERILTSLIESIQPPFQQAGTILYGPGGLGKIAIAAEFVKRAITQGLFDSVICEYTMHETLGDKGNTILLDNSSWSIDGLLDAIAKQIDQPDILEVPTVNKQLRLQKLFEKNRYLLLLNNLHLKRYVDDSVFFAVLRSLRSSRSNSYIIITSRSNISHYLGGFQSFSISSLSLESTVAFVKADASARGAKQLLNTSTEVFQKIHEASHGMPLALKMIVSQARFLDLQVILKNFTNYSNVRGGSSGESMLNLDPNAST